MPVNFQKFLLSQRFTNLLKPVLNSIPLLLHLAMGHSDLAGLCQFILLDLSQQIIVPIALGYLLGQLHKLVQFLLPLLLIFLQLYGEVERVIATHRYLFK